MVQSEVFFVLSEVGVGGGFHDRRMHSASEGQVECCDVSWLRGGRERERDRNLGDTVLLLTPVGGEVGGFGSYAGGGVDVLDAGLKKRCAGV